MVRRFIYILLSLAVAVSAVSCLEEMEVAQPKPEGSDETILVPRVKSFTNQYITKGYGDANETANETKIERLVVLIFNKAGNLVYKNETYRDGEAVSLITLNKSFLNSPEQNTTDEATQAKINLLKSSTVVMIANVPLEKITRVKSGTTTETETLKTASPSLTEMEQFSINFEDAQTIVTDITSTGFTGFPMIGGSSNVDLTAANTEQEIVIGMKILYAKINFSISVDAGTENEPYEGVDPAFELRNYSVFNASKATTIAIPEEGEATASASYAYTATGAAGTASGKTTLEGRTPVKFTFYVAESRYNHNSDLKGIYPDDNWLASSDDDDVKGYSKMSDKDKAEPENQLNGVKYFYDDLIQQYKPKLATQSPDGAPAAGMATYVILDGSYTDYRGTVWDVKYKVYLGKDNAHNFHVDRNSEYTNLITIKGIRNRQNGAYGDGEVWIDHRINVSYNGTGADDHVTITRETLIDSHIEVRPLRVNWDNDKYAGVRVYLPTTSDGTTPVNWIGIERFTGNNNQEGAVYCYQNGKSTGKRKYFTNGLISELQSKGGELGVQTDNGKKFIYLLDGECAWIYFDGNTTTSERTADLKLAFYSAAGNVQTEEIYQIKQRGLQSIGGYTVESYEEYLHSYDSADKYNLSTSPVDYTQQGLSWGLTNKTISQDIIVSATSLNGIQNYVDQRYDYFHKSDIPPTETYYTYQLVDGSWANASYGTGLVFTDRASAKEGITIKDMGTLPENAYQYCLSKNKFNEDADGNHTLDIHWYLPDVYELKAVLAASKGSTTAADFGSDAYYWSSQPSFGGLSFNLPIVDREISIKEEVVDNARAVSVANIQDMPRRTSNRIRCFYSATGKTGVDMKDRTPDGIGGNYSFYMKAYKDGNKSAPGYFQYLLPTATTSESTIDYKYHDNSDFPYPTKENSYGVTGAEFAYFVEKDENNKTVEGFSKDPSAKGSWTEGQYYNQAQMLVTANGYYTTLATYPGLSPFTLTKHNSGNFYAETTTERTDVKNTTTTSTVVHTISSLASAPNLYTLDHLINGNMFNISFAKQNGNKDPWYDYDELESEIKTETVKKWQVPTYEYDEYKTAADEQTVSFTATESHIGEQLGSIGKYNLGKMSAFGSIEIDLGRLGKYTFGNGAYAKAKEAAKQGVENIIKEKYPNYSYNITDDDYTKLEWDDDVTEIKYTEQDKSWSGTSYECTVTVTCTVKVTLAGGMTGYWKDAADGGWVEQKPETKTRGPIINTDELKMYSGNSFTISLSDALDEKGVPYKDGYEITKVKVYYSGNNLVYRGGGFLGIGEDEVYTRFVDSEITLPPNPLEIPYGGSTETLQLPGMDYNEDATSGTGTHQWTGDGKQSVTLVLTDYFVNDQATSRKYTYQYTRTAKYPNEYIIIDRIEVKCTPKSTTGQ